MTGLPRAIKYGLAAAVVFAASPAVASECVVQPRNEAFAAAMLDGKKRVALLVGNTSYSGLPTLANPARDIALLAERLRFLGFDVLVGNDLTAPQFQDCLDEFTRRTATADVAMVHYSGHAMQLGDANYLLMRDADPARDLVASSVRLDPVLAALRLARFGILSLDACRSNPLVRRPIQFASRSIEATRVGLAPVGTDTAALGANILVAYATSPNDVAADGSGKASPYSAALARNLGAPGASIQESFAAVSREVGEATNYAQAPWTRSSLTDALRLNGTMRASEVVERSRQMAEMTDMGQMETFARRTGVNPRTYAIGEALKALPFGVEATDVRFEPAFDALTNALLASVPTLAAVPKGYGIQAPAQHRAITGNFYENDEEGRFPVELWDTARGKPLKVLLSAASANGRFSLSPDGRRAAAVGTDHRVHVFSTAEGQEIRQLVFPAAERDEDWSLLRFSPSGRYLLGQYGWPDKVVVWDVDGKDVQIFPNPMTVEGQEARFNFDHGVAFDEGTMSLYLAGSVSVNREEQPFAAFVARGQIRRIDTPIAFRHDVGVVGDGTAIAVANSLEADDDGDGWEDNDRVLVQTHFWRINFKRQTIEKMAVVDGQTDAVDAQNGVARIGTIDYDRSRLMVRYVDVRTGETIRRPARMAGYNALYSAASEKSANASPADGDISLFDPNVWRAPAGPDNIVAVANEALGDKLAAQTAKARLRLFEQDRGTASPPR